PGHPRAPLARRHDEPVVDGHRARARAGDARTAQRDAASSLGADRRQAAAVRARRNDRRAARARRCDRLVPGAAARQHLAASCPHRRLSSDDARAGIVRVDHFVDAAAGDDDVDVLLPDADDVPVRVHLSDREHAGGHSADYLPHTAEVLPRNPQIDFSERRRTRNALAAGCRAHRLGRGHSVPRHSAVVETRGMTRWKCDNRPMRALLLRACFVVMFACGVAMIRAAAQDPGTAAAPGDPLELVKQARKLNNEGKQDAALELYRQVLERSPDLFDAHLGAGIALDLQGNYKDARKHLARAIELAPDGGKNQALSTMAVSYAFERDTAGASRFYRQVFDRQESTQDLGGAAETANALGRIYLESGDFDNALKWYQTGYETSRRQPKLTGDQIDLWTMRWAHAQARIAARKGNVEDARKQTAA